MNVFEFTGKIENGAIRIPPSFVASYGGGDLRVLVCLMPAHRDSEAKKANLKAALMHAAALNVFRAFKTLFHGKNSLGMSGDRRALLDTNIIIFASKGVWTSTHSPGSRHNSFKSA